MTYLYPAHTGVSWNFIAPYFVISFRLELDLPLDLAWNTGLVLTMCDLHQVYIDINLKSYSGIVTDCVTSFGVVDNHSLSVVMIHVWIYSFDSGFIYLFRLKYW